MLKNKSGLLVALSVIILVFGGYLLFPPKEVRESAKVCKNIPVEQVCYSGVEGKTALEILKANEKVETQSTSYGDFVTTINDRKADSTKEFWGFYVNGKLAAEGAGTYKTKDSDVVVWKIDPFTN
ncbi:DUF4430 domain-containing protein [Candidatus Berkelbacteria bacterium]|nr:DUF4430 domain-containing protein [Candidatus Berkelbacteria bacterium]